VVVAALAGRGVDAPLLSDLGGVKSVMSGTLSMYL
jgi:hypothetical protein